MGLVWSAATLGPRASRPHGIEGCRRRRHAGGTPAVPGSPHSILNEWGFALRLGLNLGYWGADAKDHVALAREAENLGFHSLWTAEAYGSDSVTPLVWLAAKTERIKIGTAVMQMPARTPAMTAMIAATIDLL